MDPVWIDVSQSGLVEAIRANLYASFFEFRRSPHCEFAAENGLTRWGTPFDYAWFNGVLAGRPADGNGDAARIRSLQQHYAAHGISTMTWWIGNGVPADGWDAMLRAAGFLPGHGTPGMAADLYQLNEDGPAPQDFTVQPVTDLDTLRVWTRLFAAGYPIPDEWEPDFYRIVVDLGWELPFRYYLGYLHGVPVATSTLYLGAGAAGIYNVTTLSAARGRGIGGMMTLAPLQEARQMGYRVAALQSSELGYRVYKKLGFQHVCDLDHYYWSSC